MKKKELKTLAKKIAELEQIIQANEDADKVAAAKNEELKLASKVTDFSDLDLLDDMVQKYMQENNE